MLAVSLYLIWFNSLQKTPQTEFAILVVFSFLFSFFFFLKSKYCESRKFSYRYLVFAYSSRGVETNETTEGDQVREIALKHVFFKERLKKNRSYNVLCFSTVNVGYLVNCLVVLKDS